MPHKAKLNIIGPNGELVKDGDELPDDWPEEFVADLVKGGAVEEIEEPQVVKATVKKVTAAVKKRAES